MAAKKKTNGKRKLAELDAHELRAVAAEAKVDPRSVARALDGRRQSDAVKVAIAGALRSRGHKAHAAAVEAAS